MAVGSCGWQHPPEPWRENAVSQRGELDRPSSSCPPFESCRAVLVHTLDSARYKQETVILSPSQSSFLENSAIWMKPQSCHRAFQSLLDSTKCCPTSSSQTLWSSNNTNSCPIASLLPQLGSASICWKTPLKGVMLLAFCLSPHSTCSPTD